MKRKTQNKVHVLRFRVINKSIFEAIKSGEKKVETRAATEKYQAITSGDVLKFVCGKKYFNRSVSGVFIFKTIATLLKRYRVKEINPHVGSKEDLVAMYYSFPGYYEKIQKYGIVAFKLI